MKSLIATGAATFLLVAACGCGGTSANANRPETVISSHTWAGGGAPPKAGAWNAPPASVATCLRGLGFTVSSVAKHAGEKRLAATAQGISWVVSFDLDRPTSFDYAGPRTPSPAQQTAFVNCLH
jgi:hypothetical protein